MERLAKERNLSLIGAANLSECEVGWFVKDGIDDLPVQPMAGLYKTQVRQLAKTLDLPEPVRTQLPSPDMAKGVTDEFGGRSLILASRVARFVVDGFDRKRWAEPSIWRCKVRSWKQPDRGFGTGYTEVIAG